MLAASLVYDLTHACLTHLERLHRISLGGELLAPAAHPTAREVNLSKGLLTLGILLRVDLPKDLQISHPPHFLLSVGQAARVIVRTRVESCSLVATVVTVSFLSHPFSVCLSVCLLLQLILVTRECR